MRNGRGRGFYPFIRQHTCDLCVLTKEWRKMRKLKPGHVLSLSTVPCSHFRAFNKNPVIPHNCLHCAVFLFKRHFLSGVNPRIPWTRRLGENCRYLRGKSSERKSELIQDKFDRRSYTEKLLTAFNRKILKSKNNSHLLMCFDGFVTGVNEGKKT